MLNKFDVKCTVAMNSGR